MFRSRAFRVPRPPVLAALILLAFVVAGCDGKRDEKPAGVPVSRELLAALEADEGAGRSGRGDARFVADLELYERLAVDIQRQETRQAAGDRLYAAWRADPTNFLWISHAAGYNYLLRRNAERNAMYARSELADTASVVGAYVQGRRFYRYGSDGGPYERAWTASGELDALQRAWLARDVAMVRSNAGDPLTAVQLLLAELPAARAAGGDRLAAYYWEAIGTHLRGADRLDDALHANARAERLAAGLDDGYRVLLSRRIRADIMADRREATAALDLYREVTASAEVGRFPWLVTSSLDQAASLHASLGDVAGALSADRRNVAHCLAIADSINAPREMMNVAHDFLLLGEMDSCLVHQRRARRLVEAFGDERNLAVLPALEAEYFLQIGAYATAESLLALASERSGRTGLALDEAEILLSQVRQGLETSRPEMAYRALRRLEQLEPVLQDRAADQNLRADIAIAAADFLGRQGEFAEAAGMLDRAAAAVRARGGEGKLWEYQRSVGDLALARGDLFAAETAFAACVESAETAGWRDKALAARFDLGSVLLLQGRAVEARRHFAVMDDDAAFGGRFRTRITSRLCLGLAHRSEGDEARAEQLFREGLALATPRTPPDLTCRLRLELGRSLAARGDADAAESELMAAAALAAAAPHGTRFAELRRFDGDVRRAVFEARVGLYLDAPDLVRGGDPARATLVLVEELRGSIPADTASEPGPTLVYFTGRDRSFVWVRVRDDVRVSPLPGAEELARLAAAVLAEMQDTRRPPDQARALRLSRLVLGPAAGDWLPGTTLRVLPDGILSLLPWAALPWPRPDDSDAGPVELAIDRGPILLVAPGLVPRRSTP
ncbi:MAG: hypothetical protein C0418_05630, partial [Coriobacteriaceae bacterium]|nr:hypothetical protein [Coriobacteriaceae bacterium]